MGSLRACVHVVIAFVVASCGFPRPADVPDDGATSADPTYQLLAVTPAIATTDDTLTLEGTFASTATVRFPGGAVQAATVLGAHRATVIVPAAATAGDLTVTTGDVTVGPLAFRRTSFALGLQQFRASYEQADGGRQSPALATPRLAPTSLIVKNWLYVLGGTDGLGGLGSIERAPINADSTIGSFDLVTTTMLATPRSGHASVVIGSWLYVLGGAGPAGPLTSVERAAILPDGSLGSFGRIEGAALTTGRTGHTTAIIGSSLYVIGGVQGDGKKLASIERAAILPDGSLGPFEAVSAVALDTPRSDHTSEVIGTTLYVLGGDAGSGVRLGDIERAAILPDGTLGPFNPVTGVNLTVARSGHRSVVVGNGLYVVGGTGSSGVSASVERASIAADGSLAPFSPVSSLTLIAPRTGAAITTVGTSLYLLSGSDPVGPVRTVEHASLNADSAVGPFATSDRALVMSRAHHTSTVVRNFVYVIGRSGSDNSIERASINPDGSLGSFATVSGVSLVSRRDGHTTVVVRNFLYVIGGEQVGYLSDVERASINTDGSLGPFAPVSGVTLNEARFGHISVVLGNFLYVIGGFGNQGRLASIERAIINADGTLSPFVTLTNVALNTARQLFTGLVTGSYLYVIGGGSNDPATLRAGIERAPIGGDGSVGAFTPVPSLLDPRMAHANAIVGNTLYVIGGLAASVQAPAIERATINADGSLSGFTAVAGIMAATPRARHTATVVGNSLQLIGGDVDILHSVEQAGLR